MTERISGVSRPWMPIGVVLFAVALRLTAITGDLPPDALVYSQYAWNLTDGTFEIATDSWYAHRLPVFVPVAGLYALFGVDTATSLLWPFLLSLGQVVLALVVGRKYFGDAAGLLAGFLLAIYPLDVLEAGMLMPDIVMGGLVGWAGALWFLAPRWPSRIRPGALLASGICLALAVVVRPYALLLVIYLIADTVIRRLPIRSLLWLAVGIGAVALPLLGVYQVTTGDALYRVGVISQTYSSGVMAEDPRWLFYISHIWSPKSVTGLFPLLLVGSCLYVLLRPDRARVSLLLWVVLFAAFLQFGSMSLSEFVPILKRTRFLTPVSLPAAVLVGSVLAAVSGLSKEASGAFAIRPRSHVRVRAALFALLAVLLAASVWRIYTDRSSVVARVEGIREVAGVVRRQQDSRVLLDHWRSAIRLAHYLDFEAGSHYYQGADDANRMRRDRMPPDARFGYLSWYPDTSMVPGGLVLLDDRVLAQYRQGTARGLTFRAGEIPEYAFRVPASWEPVVDRGGMRLYRVPLPEGHPPKDDAR